VSDFLEGLAAVKIDGKCGYADKTGQCVIPSQFDAASDFSEGLAVVAINVKYELNLAVIDYQKDKYPRFGKCNPEEMDVPFWREMVLLGWIAYGARRHYLSGHRL
jgi:WG containing repeat